MLSSYYCITSTQCRFVNDRSPKHVADESCEYRKSSTNENGRYCKEWCCREKVWKDIVKFLDEDNIPKTLGVQNTFNLYIVNKLDLNNIYFRVI